MAQPFQFALLLQLARDKREEAVRQMQWAQQHLDQGLQQQQEIGRYREEYRARLATNSQQGILIQQWNDFQLFLARLDAAVEQMREEVLRRESGFLAAKQCWFECEKEVKAFETLAIRHQEQVLRREGRREQQLSDEWVNIVFSARVDASGSSS